MQVAKWIIILGCFTGIVACKQNQVVPSIRSMEWVPITTPSEEGGQSQLHTSPDDHLYLSWIEYTSDTAVELRYARWDTTKWDYIRTIAKGGSDWFVNWADMPSITQFYPDRNRLVAHWLQYSGPGNYDYNVMLSSSSNAGLNWSIGSQLHRDTTKSEHGFVSMVTTSENEICAVWLDGRETKPGVNHEHHQHAGAMTLRSTFLTDSGYTAPEYVLDSMVCDCCQTDVTYVNGQILVVYRDRSDTEIRDISLVRYNGEKWEIPVPVSMDHWQIGGCPVNGPAIASKDGQVAVAWYTEANDQPKVQVAFSDDLGHTFTEPIIIDDQRPLGRVDIEFYDDQSVLVSWMQSQGNEACIVAKLVSSSGEVSENFCLIETNPSRQSGFPRLARSADQFFISFTEVLDDNKPRVQTGIIEILDDHTPL